MSSLREIVSRCLISEGAIVEPLEPEGLEVLAPPRIQEVLEIEEWSRLGFGSQLPNQARLVSLESDWPERLEHLLGHRGRYAYLSLVGRFGAAWCPRADRAVERAIILENATYRAEPSAEAVTLYLLLTFRITALSDEKREDLIHLCINESNGAVDDRLPEAIPAYLRSMAEVPGAPSLPGEPSRTWSSDHLQELASKALPSRIQARLSPFLAGMTRRMKRDLECLQAYYSKLQSEIVSRVPGEKQEEGESDSNDLRKMRLEAVDREYRAKVEDLQRKYTTQVEVRLSQALRLAMPVGRVRLAVRRRRGSRSLLLDWNPLTRQLDSLPCEACFAVPRTHRVCDDALHLLCTACLSPCDSCRKKFCRACHRKGCPKCSRIRRSQRADASARSGRASPTGSSL